MDQLHLDIIQCSCSCGNRWTHSRTLLASSDGALGGTPSPHQELKLRYESITELRWNTNGCHRCVPLQLSKNWTQPLPAQRFEPKPAIEPLNPAAKAEKELLS